MFHTAQLVSCGVRRSARALTVLSHLAGCLALLLLAGCSHSDSWFADSPTGPTRPAATASPAPCEAGPRWELFLALDTMPRPLINAFVSRLAGQTEEGFRPIVGRDQFFNATEKASDPQVATRRFVQGGHLGDAWVVLYEQGGPAPRVHAVVYDWPDRNGSPELKAHVDTTAKTMCDTVKDILSRPNDPQPILEDW